MKLTEQTTGHVQLSTHMSAKLQLDDIHLEVPGMLLLPKCIVVAECMAVPCDEIRLSVEFVTVGFLGICRQYCCD